MVDSERYPDDWGGDKTRFKGCGPIGIVSIVIWIVILLGVYRYAR